MSQTIDQVYSDFNVQGVPASGEKKPSKAEIRALLKMIQNSGGQAVTRNTLSALNAVTPPNENFMGVVLTGADAGYYSRSGGAWVFGRGFPDTFAKVALSGTGTAQAGAISAGVNPASIEVFFANVATANTGALTLSISGETPKPVVNLAGNPLSAGEWTGMVMFHLNDDGQYQLLIDAGAAASAAANANRAEDEADRAQAIADGIAPGAVPDGGVTPVKLSDSAKNYLAGSGVLDARSVIRETPISTQRGTVSINAGSNQLTFGNGLVLEEDDYVWVSGAGASRTTYSVTFNILGSPLQSRTLYIVCDGFIFNANHVSGGIPVLTSDTAAQVAAKIRAGSWPGWTVGGSGTNVTFTRAQPGGTLGAHWSDVDFAIIPKTETVTQEGGGDLLARVLSVAGNVATLDATASASVTNALGYHEFGRPIRLAMQADPTIKSVQMPQGDYFFSDGLRFGTDGGSFVAAGVNRTFIYALPGTGHILDFTSSVTNGALHGIRCEGFTLDMQNNRRPGIRCSRLWDGSTLRTALIRAVAKGHMGLRIGRHPLGPVPSSASDQSVVSQSVAMENFHLQRTNPSQDDDTPIFYQEFVQEGTYVNVKALSGTDTNGHGSTVAMQVEGCRGLKFVGSSFGLAGTAVKITSVEGEAEGITFVTPTIETASRAVHCAGGSYEIEDVNVIAPRIIGAGNQFVIDKCSRGHFETQDRTVQVSGAVRKNTFITDNPTLITDADGLGANVVLARHYLSGGAYRNYANNVNGHQLALGSYMGAQVVLPEANGQTSLIVLGQTADGGIGTYRLLIGAPDSDGPGLRKAYFVN